ncbi:MAG: hypothetical protein KBT08_05470 [Bacteroidales bacterium]|nr:hypothetical protein [Candidatus Cryptobacteroides onthequi]
MKRIISTILSVLAFSLVCSAQSENLTPGIYSIIDGNATHLTYANGAAISSSNNLLGVEIGNTKFKYKGETAEVKVVDKIVMVINPDKKVIKKTTKEYDPFIKSMTPANIIIVPLEVVDGKRIYNGGRTIEGINTVRKERIDFEWEMVADNTFEITANFEPGEYAIIFRPAKLGEFDFTSIYGFYVEKQ